MTILLKDAVEQKKFDIRVLEKNMTRGLVPHDEIEKYLKQLSDESEFADWINPEDLNEPVRKPSHFEP